MRQRRERRQHQRRSVNRDATVLLYDSQRGADVLEALARDYGLDIGNGYDAGKGTNMSDEEWNEKFAYRPTHTPGKPRSRR